MEDVLVGLFIAMMAAALGIFILMDHKKEKK